MKLSDHFDTIEFACGCKCGFTIPDAELMDVLERLRAYYNSPVHVNSGCRCEYWNTKNNGAKDSQHIQGKAADIWISGVSATDVYAKLDEWYPDKYGIGKYYTWTHIDVRKKRARW